MSATREQLLATLAELHRELSEIGPLDGDARLQLRGTLSEIQQALDRTGESTTGLAMVSADKPVSALRQPGESLAAPTAPLTQRLSDAARELETTHPQLSIALGSVIDGLARMGI